MPLQDIIQTIEDQANKKLREIKKKNKDKEDSLILAYDEKIREKENILLNKAKKEIKEKIRKEKFLLNLNENNALLEKKWKAIDSVYEKISEKLAKMDEGEKKKIFSDWLKECPKNGEIFSSEKDRTILKELAKKEGFKISAENLDSTSEGGFVFKSEKNIIDYTFSNVIENLKNETEIGVGKILFGN